MGLKPLSSVAPEAWDRLVAAHSRGHILQTSPWGALKSRFGWNDARLALSRDGELVAGAQVLARRLPGGLGCLAYVPKGPLVDWTDGEQTQATLLALDRAARAQGAIALIIEPDLPDESTHHERLRSLGFRPSLCFDGIQPRRTLVVDISPDEDTILGGMKSKTRYNVRLAGRKGVTVREAGEADFPAFHATGRAKVHSARIVVDADVAQDDTDYATVSLVNKAGDGTGDEVLANVNTKTTGGVALEDFVAQSLGFDVASFINAFRHLINLV